MHIAEAIVFVVDDDVSIRRAMQRLLHTEGLAVETFASAWEFVQREPPTGPACLVLDVHMPEVSGPSTSCPSSPHRLWDCPKERPGHEGRRLGLSPETLRR